MFSFLFLFLFFFFNKFQKSVFEANLPLDSLVPSVGLSLHRQAAARRIATLDAEKDKKEIEALGLKYSLITSETSFGAMFENTALAEGEMVRVEVVPGLHGNDLGPAVLVEQQPQFMSALVKKSDRASSMSSSSSIQGGGGRGSGKQIMKSKKSRSSRKASPTQSPRSQAAAKSTALSGAPRAMKPAQFDSADFALPPPPKSASPAAAPPRARSPSPTAREESEKRLSPTTGKLSPSSSSKTSPTASRVSGGPDPVIDAANAQVLIFVFILLFSFCHFFPSRMLLGSGLWLMHLL